MHATNQLRVHGFVGIFGLALGASLGMIGFGDFAELNAMFTLQDLRMLFTFMGAVAVAGALFYTFTKDRPKGPPIHRGIVPGAVLFGTGWAISGGCPSIPIVQLGTGYLPALMTMAGIATGMRAYRKLNARYSHFDTGACSI
ncbi:MAG: YeeE/YedE family protein [Acidimicrobiaceae bacterium]|nr:YeeE/YedE family protein [Acidimicrobiaceae bacterium]